QTWDTDLEVAAQKHAKNCTWGQNGERSRTNLFATASTLDVKLAIEEWNGEWKFYNLTTSMCDPGQTCDNYTQVVWADTSRVGCGKSSCKKMDGIEIENAQLLVCKYFPPANMKGKKPYKEGPSCKSCPMVTVCENNLCGEQALESLLAPSLKRIFSSKVMFSSSTSVSARNANLNQTSVDPPKDGAPRICLGLLLFLLPSAILMGLLL
ncbi:PI16 inhibitor, partial [Acrocephalus arundinaceus]|nr:PI16 inhibitor [Acrocephalus arundinaceus]